MNDLLVLVKLLSAIYQAKKLDDTNLLKELEETLEELPAPPPDVFAQDKEARDSIRATISWLIDQPSDDVVLIKSNLMMRVRLFCKGDEALKAAIEDGLEDLEKEEMTRRLIYKHISEVRLSLEGKEFGNRWKKAVKSLFYKDHSEVSKEEWVQLADMINERMTVAYEERQSEIVHTVTSDDPESFHGIIEMAKKENSKEGILKSGLQGLNEALEPDGGFRRSKFYLLNALTNRGKSLTMAHITASIGLYNKPMLRNPTKIPTILQESAEDTMDLIIMRMYKLALTVRHDIEADFQIADRDEIVNAIVNCFKDNGWFLIINQIESSKDDCNAMFNRVRRLEMKGHEIIFYGYDYCGLQNYDKLPGESKSDKLQLHFRKIRAFIIARGICFATPHQLSPDAKKKLQESDEESEVYFAREVAGKSLTETSTKITNEVDVEITFHVAKTSFKNYWTYCVGKQRGEGCAPEKRFGIYDIDPVKGLKHDINGKPMFRRSLTYKFDENGNQVKDWDAL